MNLINITGPNPDKRLKRRIVRDQGQNWRPFAQNKAISFHLQVVNMTRNWGMNLQQILTVQQIRAATNPR